MNNKDLAKEEQIKTAEVSDDSAIANQETPGWLYNTPTSPIYYPKKHTIESYRSQQKKRRKL